jgi:hypothetical protein
MGKTHFVVEWSPDGGRRMHPMKQWVRSHTAEVPLDVDVHDPASTSHVIRAALRRKGWQQVIEQTEVWMIPPDAPSIVEEDLAAGEEDTDETYGGEHFQETHFGLEHHLQQFLAHNISAIDIGGPRLKLYADARGSGVEYSTDVGRIDILAIDQNGEFYVFELKRASGPDKAVGQVARYMGWVKNHIADGKPVHGVIVAREIGQNLRYAMLAVSGLMVYEYKVAFNLDRIAGPDVKVAST